MIKLDERLQAVLTLVRPGSTVADIGTDHGYLLAQLILEGKSPGGFGCDIHPAPLEKARQTFCEYGLKDKVKLMLADGLDGLNPGEVDDIVIAGMGGETILQIINRAGWKDPRHRYILQPMTKAPLLRAGLYASGYEILCETAAFSGRFGYAVMRVGYTGVAKEMPAWFCWCGKLPENPGQKSLRYLQRQQQKVKTVLAGLAKAGTHDEKYKEYDEIEKKLAEIIAHMERARGTQWV